MHDQEKELSAGPAEPEEVRYPDGRIVHPSVQREHTDAKFRYVFVILLVTIVLGALNFYLVKEFFGWQVARQQELKKSSFPLAPDRAAQLPPEPRLEQIDRLSANESVFEDQSARFKTLNSYGPASEPGFVHIPIKLALKHYAGQLPVREQPPSDRSKDKGLVDAGESNSGRMLRGK